MEIISGRRVSGGYVMGKMKIIRRHRSITELTRSSDPESEKNLLDEAVAKLEAEMDKMYRNALLRVGESEASIFEIHKMMLSDEDFIGEAERLIREEKYTAAGAVRKSGEILAETFRTMETEYMKARAADIIAVSDRLCSIISGDDGLPTLTEPSIIAADDFTPAETVMLDRDSVLGFITEGGSDMSHTAILARMMGIPAVVSVGRIPDELDGHIVMLDGKNGKAYIDPDEEVKREYEQAMKSNESERLRLEKMRGVRLKNSMGERVFISANAGEPDDIDEAVKNDAEGVGLFRSEFIFMSRTKPPTEDEQFEIYRTAAKKLKGAELVVRTLDVGADKRISYLSGGRGTPAGKYGSSSAEITNTPTSLFNSSRGVVSEPNPALGIRGVRLCLKMPELLFTQLRALYRAAADYRLSVLIPMIVLPSEVDRVREIASSVVESLEKAGIRYGRMKLGIMIETPSAAILADILAPMVDFFSIGTNDLIQYTVAADRENPDVEYLTSPIPESVRRCIRMTCDAAKREGIPVCVCGELGADTGETKFLLECGVTRLSVSPKSILRVREKAARALGYNEVKNKIITEIGTAIN